MQARRTAWRPHNPFTVTILTQIHIQSTCTYPASRFTKNISHQQVFYLQDDASDASPNILPGDIPNGKFPLYLAFVQFYMVKIHRNNGFRWNVWWPGSPRLSGRAYRNMPNVTDALTPLLTLITFRPNTTKHTDTEIKNLGLETANHSYKKAEIFSRTLKTHTRSITTSLPHSERHSAATLQTCITASGLSAFTWKIGALTTRATSVQYGDERDERGSVVKPIWTRTLHAPLPAR